MSARSESPRGNGARRESEELQREGEALRAEMSRTLNALERKLSPRQLLDRSLQFVQASGGDVLQKIGATVNKQPLPLLLTSAGLIWLVAASRRSSSSSSSDRRYSSMSARSGEFDRPSQSFESSMRNRSRGLKHRAHRTLDATRERASRTWGTTRERTQELGGNLNGLIREQPLVSGAIALAIGAIIGAAFPVTAYERDLVARAGRTGEGMLDELSTRAEREPLTGTTAEAPPTSH